MTETKSTQAGERTLQSAAPELLEAIKAIYARRTDILNAANKVGLGAGGLEFALRKAQSAIAKAEGRSE